MKHGCATSITVFKSEKDGRLYMELEGFRMPNKMERFTPTARYVLALAQQEAEHMQHNDVGTHHLLLAVVREETGMAGRVLRNSGLEPCQIE